MKAVAESREFTVAYTSHSPSEFTVSRFTVASLLAVAFTTELAFAIPPPPSLARVTQPQMLERVATLAQEKEGAPSNVFVGALGTRSEALFVVSELFSRPQFWIAWPEKADARLGEAATKLVRIDLMNDDISRWSLSGVEAAFTVDLGGDQTPDIVVMTTQMAGAGPEAAVEFAFNYVFRWKDGRYVYANDLEAQLSKIATTAELRKRLEPMTRRP